MSLCKYVKGGVTFIQIKKQNDLVRSHFLFNCQHDLLLQLEEAEMIDGTNFGKKPISFLPIHIKKHIYISINQELIFSKYQAHFVETINALDFKVWLSSCLPPAVKEYKIRISLKSLNKEVIQKFPNFRYSNILCMNSHFGMKLFFQSCLFLCLGTSMSGLCKWTSVSGKKSGSQSQQLYHFPRKR